MSAKWRTEMRVSSRGRKFRKMRRRRNGLIKTAAALGVAAKKWVRV